MKKKKVAFVIIRYGNDVVGGDSAFCKIIAEHMSKLWDIQVITTDSNDHFSWNKTYDKKKETINGILVHRFPVDDRTDLIKIGELSHALFNGQLTTQEEYDWVYAHGPNSKAMFDYIKKNKDIYDGFVFWGFLWSHVVFGMPAVREKSILVPFIHDEPAFYLDIYRKQFEDAAGIIFQTPEEKELLTSTWKKATKNTVIAGTTVDVPENPQKIELDKKYQIQDPYIVYVGRVEPAKGVNDLALYFKIYKKRNPGNLRLVLVGSRNNDIPDSDDIINLGPVFGDQKFAIMNRAEILINPSAFESFSLVIAEAWLSGTPTLVNATCAVLKGQSSRSNGGLWYENYEEFEAMLTMMLDNPELRKQMAEYGKQYINENYTWPLIEEKYQKILEKAVGK